MSLTLERRSQFDNLQGTHWIGRNCVFSSTWFTYKYSYHQIARTGFELLSNSYNLNYKNCSTVDGWMWNLKQLFPVQVG